MKVYIVTYNGYVSQEGYKKVEKAIEFIESRYGNPVKIDPYSYIDDKQGLYEIREINVV